MQHFLILLMGKSEIAAMGRALPSSSAPWLEEKQQRSPGSARVNAPGEPNVERLTASGRYSTTESVVCLCTKMFLGHFASSLEMPLIPASVSKGVDKWQCSILFILPWFQFYELVTIYFPIISSPDSHKVIRWASNLPRKYAGKQDYLGRKRSYDHPFHFYVNPTAGFV